MPTGGTYAFADVAATYSGAFGIIDFTDCGTTDEGISIEFAEDKGSIQYGADGGWMQSLHAAQGGTVTVRVFKTSPINSTLSRAYNYETSSSAYYGRGVFTIRNPQTGDIFHCTGCGFRKFPTNGNSKEGAAHEWVFNAGYIDPRLGDGNPALAVNGGI